MLLIENLDLRTKNDETVKKLRSIEKCCDDLKKDLVIATKSEKRRRFTMHDISFRNIQQEGHEGWSID